MQKAIDFIHQNAPKVLEILQKDGLYTDTSDVDLVVRLSLVALGLEMSGCKTPEAEAALAVYNQVRTCRQDRVIELYREKVQALVGDHDGDIVVTQQTADIVMAIVEGGVRAGTATPLSFEVSDGIIIKCNGYIQIEVSDTSICVLYKHKESWEAELFKLDQVGEAVKFLKRY